MNFNVPYLMEKEGQIEFFTAYDIPYDTDESILVDNTDGIFNGNILEFKLNISNLNKVLFQAIKYLSKMRIKGESVPATILLIDLNSTTVYVYKSVDYKTEIHQVYTTASSRDISGFAAKDYLEKYDYSTDVGSAAVRKILKSQKSLADMYLPIDIDENCIVGWAERYYRELPNANKGQFLGDDNGTAIKEIGEIRKPVHFKYLINPYKGKSNEKFKYLMDCLNDRLSKKDLGAFYTPMPYARKAAELVQMAVERVPDGNDYIILDRCAGTGNLESALIGIYDKNGDELISHCVVSTYEYYEYKVLQERIGDKVRDIIPPTEANVIYANGKVANADAMSEEYIKNPIIRQYVDNPKCTIILFENPPFSDTFGEISSDDKRDIRKDSYVSKIFKENFVSDIRGQIPSKDISNLFIWSGFNLYLRHNTDSYIVFCPIKYWKSNHINNNKFIDGFIFNREYFHASSSAISCILWSCEEDLFCESLKVEIYDIIENNIINLGSMVLNKVHKQFNQFFFDKRIDVNDEQTGIYCKSDGYEGNKLNSTSTVNIYNDNIIGYLHIIGFTFGLQTLNLTRCTLNVRKNGFSLRKDNYLKKLPLFAAKAYPQDVWFKKNVYYTTADGGDAYTKDADFLKSCLIYTCLSNQNKCLTFKGSDRRHYQNELCFDDNTVASKDLARMCLDNEERALMDLWFKILAEAKQTVNYNPEWTYGVYQISKELNTFKVVGTGKNKKNVYDYPVLNGDLDTLRTKLKDYYKSHITQKMFKYELLK